MTCGECKHLKKANHPRYSHICMAPLPAWTLYLIYEDSYLTPDAVFDNCPCFERKENAMAPPPPGWPGLNKGFVREGE